MPIRKMDIFYLSLSELVSLNQAKGRVIKYKLLLFIFYHYYAVHEANNISRIPWRHVNFPVLEW